MPFKRSYRRKRYGNRRRFKRFNRKGSKMSRDVRWLKRQFKQSKPQLQFVDTVATDADIFTTPTVVKILAMAGSASRVTIKSIQMTGRLIAAESAPSSYYFRIVIFTDKSNEGGAIPAWTDVYKGATGSDAIQSLRYLNEIQNEGQRFRILYDKVLRVTSDADSTIDNPKFFKMYKKLALRSINRGEYWEKGGLYLAFVGTGDTSECDFTYEIRTRFVSNSEG